MSHRVFVQSFEPQHLRWVRELAPALPLGLLRTTLDPDPLAIAKDLELSAYNPSEAASRTRPGIVAELHAAGVAVNIWTVDNPTSWNTLERAGVDGIITNRPAELAGWNAAFAQRVRPAATILSPAAGERIEPGRHLRVAVGNNSPELIAIILDGAPVANGAAIDTALLRAGMHTVTATVAGSTVEITFEVIAPR
jgi:glycerophosphoryl diester phosphodiesterase